MQSKSILRFLFEDYCKVHRMPVFQLNSRKIQVLNTPKEFYESLLQGIKKSEFRISLATLYLGNGPMELKLLHELQNASDMNQKLKVNLIMDRFRGTRSMNENSIFGHIQ